jgi:hypothetical protein
LLKKKDAPVMKIHAMVYIDIAGKNNRYKSGVN